MSPARRKALLSQIGEFKLIQSVSRRFSGRGPHPLVGIGDDAAIVSSPSPNHLVISTDLLVEGIHFSRKTSSWCDIGYKAAVANLSDIAAMGATPTYILVAVATPSSVTYDDWKELYRGLSIPCKVHGVQLIGGDTSSSHSILFLAVTILGHVAPHREITRYGAKEGDVIYVSGTLGNSNAGLDYLTHRISKQKISTLRQPLQYLVRRHLRPTPRVKLGQMLSSHRLASAALDLSDGLSGDLSHLCQQSRVGALIREVSLPMSHQILSYASKKHLDPLHWVLHGGEDYELLFTVPSKNQRRLEVAVKQLRIPVTAIGVITSRRSGLQIVNRNGTLRKFLPQSYVHFST